jgi:hypothetical protein
MTKSCGLNLDFNARRNTRTKVGVNYFTVLAWSPQTDKARNKIFWEDAERREDASYDAEIQLPAGVMPLLSSEDKLQHPEPVVQIESLRDAQASTLIIGIAASGLFLCFIAILVALFAKWPFWSFIFIAIIASALGWWLFHAIAAEPGYLCLDATKGTVMILNMSNCAPQKLEVIPASSLLEGVKTFSYLLDD